MLQVVSKMYMDKATLLWNGNTVTGVEEIGKFFDGLPSTYHQVESLDAQPLFSRFAKIINQA